MFEQHDDTQMVPQQMADPMALDAGYEYYRSVVTSNDGFLTAKQPLSSTSAASSSSSSPSSSSSTPKATGFDSLDELGLLDGLISPRGLATTPAGINTPQALLAGAFFGSDFKQEGAGAQSAKFHHHNNQQALVPEGHVVENHVLSCSSTPSQSPTFEAPRFRLSPVPQASMPEDVTPIETAMAVDDVASASAPSSATRRSRRQSSKGLQHRASTAASARKQAQAPVVPTPKPRAPRGPSKAAQAKAAKAAKAAFSGKAPKKSKSSSAAAAKAGKKVKKEVSTAAAAAVLTASLAQLDRSGALPEDHKPARGRGRQLQLSKMSPAQRAAEAKARLEKNRQAAKGFRARRKGHINELEARVTEFEVREEQQQAAITSLHGEIKALKRLLQQQQQQQQHNYRR